MKNQRTNLRPLNEPNDETNPELSDEDLTEKRKTRCLLVLLNILGTPI